MVYMSLITSVRISCVLLYMHITLFHIVLPGFICFVVLVCFITLSRKSEQDYSPLPWNEFFDRKDDVQIGRDVSLLSMFKVHATCCSKTFQEILILVFLIQSLLCMSRTYGQCYCTFNILGVHLYVFVSILDSICRSITDIPNVL